MSDWIYESDDVRIIADAALQRRYVAHVLSGGGESLYLSDDELEEAARGEFLRNAARLADPLGASAAVYEHITNTDVQHLRIVKVRASVSVRYAPLWAS
jgi:hypothetical protein